MQWRLQRGSGVGKGRHLPIPGSEFFVKSSGKLFLSLDFEFFVRSSDKLNLCLPLDKFVPTSESSAVP